MRRLLLAATAGLLAAAPALPDYPVVRPGVALQFPRDHGAHPAFRTEWWYITGQLRAADGAPLGFQITFFRTRPRVDPANSSRFTPRQIIFAHAALSDPVVGRLLHAERAARAGFGLAGARIGDTDLAIRDWRLKRLPDGRFLARIATPEFALALTMTPTQPPLLQGMDGYSQKGPKPGQASYYFSVPQLRVTGAMTRGGKPAPVTGRAWLDREWSWDYLGNDAIGWDWTGLNLDDGGALMAFRIRGRGGKSLWAGGSLRRRDGNITRFRPGDVVFRRLATWRSPRTGAIYPIAQEVSVRLPEGIRRWRLTPLFADQELDARRGGQPVYWEGAVRTAGGQGYLELTGYAGRLRM